jgi:hypothetical protein
MHTAKCFQQKYIVCKKQDNISADLIIHRIGCKLKYVFYPSNIHYPYKVGPVLCQGYVPEEVAQIKHKIPIKTVYFLGVIGLTLILYSVQLYH